MLGEVLLFALIWLVASLVGALLFGRFVKVSGCRTAPADTFYQFGSRIG